MSLVRTHTGTIEGRPCDYHTRTYPCSPSFTPSYQYTRPGESPNDGQWLESEAIAGHDWLKRIAAEQSAKQKPAPDPEGWKARYYPVPAEGFTGTALEAAKASRLKWSGYLPEALAEFGLDKPPVQASNAACHLCVITGYVDGANREDCNQCPLTAAGCLQCGDRRSNCGYSAAAKMVADLDKAIAYLEAEKKAEPSEGLTFEDGRHIMCGREIAADMCNAYGGQYDNAEANAELFVNAAKTKREHARMASTVRELLQWHAATTPCDPRPIAEIKADARAILAEIGGEK